MFSALAVPPFRSVRLRARRPTCLACREEGEKAGTVQETDYVALCGGARPDWLSLGLAEGSLDRRIRAKVRLSLEFWEGSFTLSSGAQGEDGRCSPVVASARRTA